MTTTKCKTTTRTRTIAGHAITLIPGRRYLASRDMVTRGRTRYDVKVRDITDGLPAHDDLACEIADLPYERANDLLVKFNNGSISFSGRVW